MCCERKPQTEETLNNAVLHDAVQILVKDQVILNGYGPKEVARTVEVNGVRFRQGAPCNARNR